MHILLTLVGIFLILVVNEINWRKRHVHGEFSRKFVHITVGSFVATWPFFLSWSDIRLLGAAFLVVVVLSHTFKIFKAIHSVQRPTWGEACFALAVIAITFITHDKWIYSASLLQMSLADGLAGVIGMRYGAKFNYIVFSHTKSLVGSLTFFIVSLIVLREYSIYSHDSISFIYICLISFITTALENISVLGIDNLSVPLLTAILLSSH